MWLRPMGLVAGYISTRIDRDAGKGRIPNLAVAAWARREGIGRALLEHALAFFREEKLEYAMIETMVSNPLGQSLYPSCGFRRWRARFTSRSGFNYLIRLMRMLRRTP